MHNRCSVAAVLSLAAFVAGCDIKKTENPLSPTVAGPMPGVSISAPRLLEPGSGWQIAGDKQPLTLLLENSSSNSPRPLSYAFEVATDAGFSNKVFTREAVTPGEGGRTALRLPDPLSSGRSYYWRAKAEDGANTGPYSEATSFVVFTPIAYDKPTPISPVNNVQVSSLTPEFRFSNAPRVGSPISPGYSIEVSSSDSFAVPMVAWQVEEQPNQTHLNAPSALPPGMQLFWRARAIDGGVSGPWSNIAVFSTPKPVVVTPTTPGPTGGGGACTSTSPLLVVQCERANYPGYLSSDRLLVFLRAVASSLNRNGVAGGPYGLLRKSNGASCGGYSCDIVCAGQGTSQRQFDVLGDSDGAQTPTWGGPKVYPDIRVDSCVVP